MTHCDDCDLPADMCQCNAAKSIAKREAAEAAAERERALVLPGVIASGFDGSCQGCRSRYRKGDPVHRTVDGWAGTLCCPDTVPDVAGIMRQAASQTQRHEDWR